MGKIKKGILGGFSGRVGNVIGGSWKGIDYMRSEATSIADPKTPKQLAQRYKFTQAVDFARPCVPLINVGLKQYATKRSEFNYLVSRICKDWWDAENEQLKFDEIFLSTGELPGITDISLSIVERGPGDNFYDALIVNFTSPSGSSGDDFVYFYAVDDGLLNPPLLVYGSSLLRSVGSFEVPLTGWVDGDIAEIYMFCVSSVDGSVSETYHLERMLEFP